MKLEKVQIEPGQLHGPLCINWESDMSLEKFADIYRSNGFTVDIDSNDLLLELEGTKVRVAVEDEWGTAITTFFKAKQYSFDATKRMLISYKSVEFHLLLLDSGFSSKPDHEFSDVRGHVFRLSHSALWGQPLIRDNLFSSQTISFFMEASVFTSSTIR